MERRTDKLTTTERRRLSKKITKAKENIMIPEKPCPLSSERRDSTHIRNCRASGTTCSDVRFLFGWRECPVFLNNRNKRKGGEKRDVGNNEKGI